MSDDFEKIICERKGPNDDKMMNALSDTMHQELLIALADIAFDSDIRGVPLKGVGDKAFSSGGDIKLFQSLNFVSIPTF